MRYSLNTGAKGYSAERHSKTCEDADTAIRAGKRMMKNQEHATIYEDGQIVRCAKKAEWK